MNNLKQERWSKYAAANAGESCLKRLLQKRINYFKGFPFRFSGFLRDSLQTQQQP